MPRRIRNRYRRNTKKQSRRQRANRSRASAPRRSRTGPIRTPASFIVRAARNLLGAIPGANVIANIADFAWNTIASSNKLGASPVTEGSVIGLNTCFYLNAAACIRESPSLCRSAGYIYTNFRDSQLMSLTITVEPINKLQYRSGSWALMFTPFRTQNDEKQYDDEKIMPSFSKVMSHQGVVSGRMDQPLTLTYRPTVKDGFIGLYLPIATNFGMVCVVYQEENRTSYNNFTADEFCARVRLSATVNLRTGTAASEAATASTTIKKMPKTTTIIHTDGSEVTYVYDHFINKSNSVEFHGLRRMGASPMEA